MKEAVFTVYKTVNKINSKYYIGVHKTKNPNDDYLGSGKLLHLAIAKYGRENFEKSILFEFDNVIDAYLKEAELVTPEVLASGMCYNIKLGGLGGWDCLNSGLASHRHDKWRTVHKKLKQDKEFNKEFRKKVSEAKKKQYSSNQGESIIEKIRTGLSEFYANGGKGSFAGKKHTDEYKRIVSEKAKARLSDPTRNSMYGMMWITNGTESTRIKKDSPIPEGWRKGRVINKNSV